LVYCEEKGCIGEVEVNRITNMKWLNSIIILLSCFMTANAQENKFQEIGQSYLLNLLSGKPDSLILPFVSEHFPYLTKKYEGGGWTMYPPGDHPKPLPGIHAIKLPEHPFLKSKHSGIRLDILTNEFPNTGSSIVTIRIGFYFQNETERNNAINEISKKFKDAGGIIQNDKPGLKTIFIRNSRENELFSPDFKMILLSDQETGKPMLGLWFEGDDYKW
jgi:hypothetical protein